MQSGEEVGNNANHSGFPIAEETAQAPTKF
jgi:hypothetical protein